MKIWFQLGKWEQGTVVGRNPGDWLVVRRSNEAAPVREVTLPLVHFRIEESELNRDDLQDIPAVSDEPPALPADFREFQEKFERMRAKAGQGGAKP